MKPKPIQGGSRPGAGRKPRPVPRKAVTVRLEPQDADKLRAVCASLGVSQAAWITAKIRASKDKSTNTIGS